MDLSKLKEQLDAKIPRSVIAQRDAGNGVRLDYLQGWYVIARLNEIFGQGAWSYSLNRLTKVFEGEVEGRYGKVFSTSYIAEVLLEVGDGRHSFIDVGYGDGSDKKNPGKAHELAVKEAVTDGLKRCAKNLGMSLGLALYDRAQEFVDDEEETKNANATSAKADVSGEKRATQRVATTAAAHSVQQGASAVSGRQPAHASAAGGVDQKYPNDTAKLAERISELSAVVVAKKKATVAGLREYMTNSYGQADKTKLNVEQATTFIKYLETQI